MSKARAVALRRELSLHERGRGRRYPHALRDRVAAFAEARRVDGASWAEIGAELGLRLETVRRWCAHNEVPASCAILPVEIVAEARTVLTVVAPSGLRVEGVTLAEVVALLQALR
jgi:hypothetical protein